jgi:hypothetical protein
MTMTRTTTLPGRRTHSSSSRMRTARRLRPRLMTTWCTTRCWRRPRLRLRTRSSTDRTDEVLCVITSRRSSRLLRWRGGRSRSGRRCSDRGNRRRCWGCCCRNKRCSGLVFAHASLIKVVLVLAVNVRALRACAQRAARRFRLSHYWGDFFAAPAGARGRHVRLQVRDGVHLERRVLSALRQPLLLGARVRPWMRVRKRERTAPPRAPRRAHAPTETHLHCADAVAASGFTHLRAGGEWRRRRRCRVERETPAAGATAHALLLPAAHASRKLLEPLGRRDLTHA